jgi:hypothetical protein
MLDLVVNRVPLPIREAIAKRKGKLIVMHECDHPDGYVRAWSGSGPLRYGGHVWKGVGDLVTIEGLGGSRKTEERVVTVTLGGVRPDQLKFVTKKVRGRILRISLAALKPGTRAVNGEPYYLCTGRCDTQDHKIETSRMASIVVTVVQPVRTLDRTPNMQWTPDWLKATYGSQITGLDDLPGVAAREESWTRE